MPIGAWAHVQFWSGSADVPPPIPSRPGYPGWQSGVIAGSLLGGLQGVYDRAAWLCRWARLWWRCTPKQRAFLERHGEALTRLDGEQVLVVGRVLATLTSDPFVTARSSVRATATTLGFHEPRAWVQLSHALKARSDWAENSWRHLDAMRQLDAVYPNLSNPEKNLLIELAYVGFAVNPRGAATRGD